MSSAFLASGLNTRTVTSRPAPQRTVPHVARAEANVDGNWLPGSKIPPYLEGLPGSNGFDPLGLAKDPVALKWFTQAELQNGRWAMLGVAGILGTDIIKHTVNPSIPDWYNAGLAAQQGSPIPFNSLLAIEFFLFNFVELKRLGDIQNPGSQGEPGSFLGLEGFFKGTGEVGYPGGIFDPLNFSKSNGYAEYKKKELANGRLAMLAFLGFYGQYLATGKGPIDGLSYHLANPAAHNFATNGVSLPLNAHPLISLLK